MGGYECPYCGMVAVADPRLMNGVVLEIEPLSSKRKIRRLQVFSTQCPVTDCGEVTLVATWEELRPVSGHPASSKKWTSLRHWRLLPESRAKAFPDFIPKPILDDYQEACLIVDRSPKASATLSRRCLQGIIRDFWKAAPSTLYLEIESIKDKVDSLTWSAIDATRKIGNIGAHMEKDINLIIDVEPHEAEALIKLIETLIEDWYIARKERTDRLEEISNIAEAKVEERASGNNKD